MDFLTTNEIAKKWGITRRREDVYLKNGRIEGTINKALCGLFLRMRKNQQTHEIMEYAKYVVR